MTDEDDYSAAETDWLAHTVDGYGYGYTKKQALLALAPPPRRPRHTPRGSGRTRWLGEDGYHGLGG